VFFFFFLAVYICRTEFYFDSRYIDSSV